MDDNITKTQEASEREETDENEDKCTEGVEDNGVRVMQEMEALFKGAACLEFVNHSAAGDFLFW